MTATTIGPERNRISNGLIILVSGVVLVLWAWGCWLYRTDQPGTMPPTVPAETTEASGASGPISTSLLLFASAVILLLALLGGYAIAVRNSRRRELLDRRKLPPSMPEGSPGTRHSRDDA